MNRPLCKNKLDKRQEKLIRRLCYLRFQFEKFKTELDLELSDIKNMAEEITKSMDDIDYVLTRPKKERQDTLNKLKYNESDFIV